MNRDDITMMLKNYRYYKMAIRDYQKSDLSQQELMATALERKYEFAAPCRVTLFSDMPIGRGGGASAPRLTGEWTLTDMMTYNEYRAAVERTDMALDLLTDEERSVITLKWMESLTLEAIGKRKGYSEAWAKKIHRSAFRKLDICFRFASVPKVEPVPVA